jgi:branched-chain amino acid transport system substrate-binding protein
VLKAGLAWSALEVASPFPIHARGEQPVKIGMVEPLSGVYAKLAEAEVAGARLALEEVNQGGGILGRQAELLIEDSANDIAVGVAKTRQLIDRDEVDFILGDLNSAVALAMTRVTAEKRKLHIVTGGTSTRSRAGIAAGTSSASARRPPWKPTRSPTRWSRNSARNGTF